MKYRVCIIVSPANPHSACFSEVAILLKYTLRELGHECDITVNDPGKSGINIILGAHLLKDAEVHDLYSYIVYQLEQLSDTEGIYSDHMHRVLLGSMGVWDYSKRNIEFLLSKGVEAYYVPLGYHQVMEQIEHSRTKDIDFLFYGSVNERRRLLLNAIYARCKSPVRVLYGVYGSERDAVISRCRIILNIHYYASQIFESVRLFYLLCNRCFVITEDSTPYPYEGVSICRVNSDLLSQTCLSYLNDLDRIEESRMLTYSQFKKFYPMRDILSNILF